MLLRVDDLKPCLAELLLRDARILLREGQRQIVQQQPYQLAVVFRANLLRDKKTARFQHTIDFTRIEISVTIDHKVEFCIFKRERITSVCLPEIDPHR